MAQGELGLINLFNQPDSLLIISSYPERGVKYSGSVCAVGGFAKNTVNSVYRYLNRQVKNKKIIILTVTGDREQIYLENGILVCRIFRRNRLSSFFRLLFFLNQFSRIKSAVLEFEFSSFGTTKIVVFFLPLILFLRLKTKHPVIVLHQVVKNLNQLSGHLGWPKNSIVIKIFNAGLRLYYYLLVLLSDKVIVLETGLKKRLTGLTGMRRKITVIPHGVDKFLEKLPRESAKQICGYKNDEIIILFFGYLTWYKGVDILIKAMTGHRLFLNGKKIRLLIAGGESLTQKQKLHYQNYFAGLNRLASRSSDVDLIGFVDEKDFSLYFSAADLVIFPYRSFISSSGPLSLAFSFGKPVLLSRNLSPYFSSPDIVKTLKRYALKKEDLMFPLEKKKIIKKIKNTFNKNIYLKISLFSNRLGNLRNFDNLAAKYYAAFSIHEKA